MELDLEIVKGGEGSGNFGHEGRPGLVGGSAPGDSEGKPVDTETINSNEENYPPGMGGENDRIPVEFIPYKVYVGVLEDWYDGFEGMKRCPISEVGLVPNVHSNFPKTSRSDSVYVTAYIDQAMAYANLYSRPLVLRIDVSKLSKDKFYYDPNDVPINNKPNQMAYRGSIPADAITPMREKKSDNPYQYLLGNLPSVRRRRRRKKEEKGGPGSGYHGHAGRPGEVGGSREDGDGEPAPSSATSGNEKPTSGPLVGEGGRKPGLINADPKVTSAVMNIVEDRMNFIPDWAKEGVDRVTLHFKEGYAFSVGGEHFKAAGDCSKDGVINIYAANVLSIKTADYIIAHEVGHGVYNKWQEKANAEEISALKVHRDWFDEAGFPKTEYMEDFKNNYPFAESRQLFNKAWDAKEDGITPYSKAWAKQDKPSETVAELFRIWHTTDNPDQAMAVNIACQINGAKRIGFAFNRMVKASQGIQK